MRGRSSKAENQILISGIKNIEKISFAIGWFFPGADKNPGFIVCRKIEGWLPNDLNAVLCV
jgi:hypothetical protein